MILEPFRQKTTEAVLVPHWASHWLEYGRAAMALELAANQHPRSGAETSDSDAEGGRLVGHPSMGSRCGFSLARRDLHESNPTRGGRTETSISRASAENVCTAL